jgi:hypothetical protein
MQGSPPDPSSTPCISRDPLVLSDSESRPFKTSIVFSLKEGPGQLFRVSECEPGGWGN